MGKEAMRVQLTVLPLAIYAHIYWLQTIKVYGDSREIWTHGKELFHTYY